jgi:hypothetical protein
MPASLDITGYAIVSDDDRNRRRRRPDAAFPAQRKGLGALPARAGACGPRGLCAPQPRDSSPTSTGPCVLSFRARRRGSRAARTAGGGTRGASLGKTWRRGSCRRAAWSPWAAARWCSISSSRSPFTAFICRAPTGSRFRADDRSFPPAARGSRPQVCRTARASLEQNDTARSRARRRTDGLATRALSGAARESQAPGRLNGVMIWTSDGGAVLCRKSRCACITTLLESASP